MDGWQVWSSGREEWDPVVVPDDRNTSDYKFVYVKWHAGKSYCVYRDTLGRWLRFQINIERPVFPGQE